MTVICYLCKGKEVVQVVGDTVGRTWPCPQCRLQEFHVQYRVTDFERQQFAGDGRDMDLYMKRGIREKLTHELADIFDVSIEVDTKKLTRTYKVDAWIILPKTKGG